MGLIILLHARSDESRFQKTVANSLKFRFVKKSFVCNNIFLYAIVQHIGRHNVSFSVKDETLMFNEQMSLF